MIRNLTLLAVLLELSRLSVVAAPVFSVARAERMGVPISITISTRQCHDADDVKRATEAAAEAALAVFDDIDATMSDYNTESEVSRLSKKPSGVWHEVSPALATVLAASKEYATLSGGAFDVSVAPLIKLWRRARREQRLPTSAQIERARATVGNDLWELDELGSRVRLAREGVRFDLGAIAKGYAIDRAFETLESHGFRSVLVDAGGDLRCGDAPADDPRGWRLGLAPTDANGVPHRIVYATRIAVATSGDTERFVEMDGVRYSHIVNPATGYGLVGAPLVIVAASTAMEADALASTVSVLGSERGLSLIEQRPTCTAMVIDTQTHNTAPLATVSSRWPWKDASPNEACRLDSRLRGNDERGNQP